MATTASPLREARHVNKFIYTMGDALFYEPFEDHYKPAQDYIDLVQSLLPANDAGWHTTREGLWCYVQPRLASLPIQGWKVHVSATLENSADILEKVTAVALERSVSFKFAVDRNILAMMGYKRWRRGSSGKFITMYPSDITCFVELLEHLYGELRSYEGPYILSDKRYRDCRVLYYRYGGIARTSRLAITGDKTLMLLTPEGDAVPDVRTPYFNLPPWATDPFPSQKSEHPELTLNDGRYLVERALGFSNSGGVYLAKDLTENKSVVIKEARAHTVIDNWGADAVQRLKKEKDILDSLRDVGIAPKALELFQDWENTFLVEEFVEGVDVREIMLTQSPLMRVHPSLEDSQRYYDNFAKLFRHLARALMHLHSRGLIFGDLSPNNLKIDPSTFVVRFMDFETAMRTGVDPPTFLFTPGFRSADSIRSSMQTAQDDLYGVASLMLYMMFPIAALSSLRSDLFQAVLKTVVTDIGWQKTNVLRIAQGLATNTLTCSQALELLDQPAEILAPSYGEYAKDETCSKVEWDLSNFLLSNMRVDPKQHLFPADPFIYQTNPLSLGFGACGTLYAMKKSDLNLPPYAYEWLDQQLKRTQAEDLAPGLLTGSAGIAWCLWELGLDEPAKKFMRMSNASPIAKAHHSHFYGMAGIGMANLFFYRRTGDAEYLETATQIAGDMISRAKENDAGIYWESAGLIHLGYGYGQSGVALFLLRLSQVSGDPRYVEAGRRALAFDMSHAIEMEKGVLSFPQIPSDTTLLPYMEAGSAGIAKVAIRYGQWDRLDMILAESHRKYAGFAGLLFGLSSFIDVFTDAYLFSNNNKYLEMAQRPISGIRDLYLIRRDQGVAVPGDGLFRVSCDYATGVAGVLRTLYRFSHRDAADFVLDELNHLTPAEEGLHR